MPRPKKYLSFKDKFEFILDYTGEEYNPKLAELERLHQVTAEDIANQPSAGFTIGEKAIKEFIDNWYADLNAHSDKTNKSLNVPLMIALADENSLSLTKSYQLLLDGTVDFALENYLEGYRFAKGNAVLICTGQMKTTESNKKALHKILDPLILELLLVYKGLQLPMYLEFSLQTLLQILKHHTGKTIAYYEKMYGFTRYYLDSVINMSNVSAVEGCSKVYKIIQEEFAMLVKQEEAFKFDFPAPKLMMEEMEREQPIDWGTLCEAYDVKFSILLGLLELKRISSASEVATLATKRAINLFKKAYLNFLNADPLDLKRNTPKSKRESYAKRSCLRCKKMFISPHCGIRQCNTCTENQRNNRIKSQQSLELDGQTYKGWSNG